MCQERIAITRTLYKKNAEKLREKAFLLHKKESKILDELLEGYL
jgi:hypothetical protein